MIAVAFVVCLLFGAIVLALSLRHMTGLERKLMLAGFAAHIGASVALVLYHEVSPGDMTIYRFYGVQIARVLDIDFVRYAPEVLKLALHIEPDLPFPVLLEGTASGTMSAYAGILIFVLGDTALGCCVMVSMFAYAGMMSMYRSIRGSLDDVERIPVLSALLFVPSATFWTSGIVKEAFLMGFLGLLVGAVHDVLARRRLLAIPAGVVGAVGAAMTKPYVLFPLVIATGGYLFALRSRRKLSFVQKLAAIVVAVVGLIGVSRLFPQFGLDNLGEAIATQQRSATLISEAAGSSVDIGDGDVQTLGGQLRYLPLGLVNALFRPALFDIRNAMSAVAALEMTLIIGSLIALVRRHRVRRIVAEIRGRAPLMFAALFVVSFGAAVGVSTTNLGTLSRYRVPMMPFYMGGVAILRARLSQRARSRKVALAAKTAGPLTREEKLRIARRGTATRARA